MKLSAVLLALAQFCASYSNASIIVLDTQVNPATGNTYHLLSQSTWTDAEAKAIELQGHLVTVNDAAEQDWLLDTFSPSRDKHLWIGLNDALQEGTFVWSSGQPITFTKWGINEPNNTFGNEDYAYIDVAHDDFWNDLRNLTEQVAPGGGFIPLHGVVEVEAMAIPEPSSLIVFMGLALCVGAGPWRRRMRTK